MGSILFQPVRQMQISLLDSIQSLLESQRIGIENVDFRLRQFSPARRLQTDRQRVDEMGHRLETSLHHRLELSLLRVQALDQRLIALSPLEVLRRGYAVVSHSRDRKIVNSVKKVRRGDELIIRVVDGFFHVDVTNKLDG